VSGIGTIRDKFASDEFEVRMYDYGACHVCGEKMQRRCVTQEIWVKGELVVVEGVPAGECRQCGERLVTAEVTRALAALLEDPQVRSRGRRMNVPIIQYAA
jgi:YgiT-type zinc finger domain-containing protein